MLLSIPRCKILLRRRCSVPVCFALSPFFVAATLLVASLNVARLARRTRELANSSRSGRDSGLPTNTFRLTNIPLFYRRNTDQTIYTNTMTRFFIVGETERDTWRSPKRINLSRINLWRVLYESSYRKFSCLFETLLYLGNTFFSSSRSNVPSVCACSIFLTWLSSYFLLFRLSPCPLSACLYQFRAPAFHLIAARFWRMARTFRSLPPTLCSFACTYQTPSTTLLALSFPDTLKLYRKYAFLIYRMAEFSSGYWYLRWNKTFLITRAETFRPGEFEGECSSVPYSSSEHSDNFRCLSLLEY